MRKRNSVTFLILRHGKTEWNLQGRLQGQGDSPLLDESIPVIQSVGDAIRGYRFDHFFRSPLGRARRSFELMGELDIATDKETEALLEISFGEYNGEKQAQVSEEFTRQRNVDKWNTRWPGGESYADLDSRVRPFSEYLQSLNGVVGILAHETVNRMLIAHLMNLPQEKFFLLKHPNHVIFKIEHGKLSSRTVGDQWHSNLGYFAV